MRYFGFLLGLLFCLNLNAQKNYKGDYGFGLKHNRGMYWAHRPIMLLMEAPTQAYEAEAYLLTYKSSKYWARYYANPKIGLALSYLDLGKPEISGYAIGILPFIEFPIFQLGKVECNLKMATGLGYLSKKWDLRTNNLNKAIGSHVNGNMRVHGVMNIPLPRNLELALGAGITHYSNGNFRMPNLGVNSLELFMGINWNKKSKIIPDQAKPRGLYDSLKHHHFEFAPMLASKMNGLIYPKRILVWGAGLRYYYRVSGRSQWGTGIDYNFDSEHVYRDNPDARTQDPNLSNSSELATVLGHELLLGKFGFVSDIGVYVYRPSRLKEFMYQRLGFKYRIHPNWIVRGTIKAHFSRADYFEWGVSYSISR